MKATTRKKNAQKIRRFVRTRAKINGTAVRPRLTVFRSNKEIYAQLIDDSKNITLVAANSRELEKATKGKRAEDTGFTKVPEAFRVGELLAKKALAKKVELVAFDRGGYIYTGRVKALAEGAREGGLKF
jgi:large subunit ribosomal protein L18